MSLFVKWKANSTLPKNPFSGWCVWRLHWPHTGPEWTCAVDVIVSLLLPWFFESKTPRCDTRRVEAQSMPDLGCLMRWTSFQGTPHLPGCKFASHPCSQMPLEHEPILCNQAHGDGGSPACLCWVPTALSHSSLWIEILYGVNTSQIETCRVGFSIPPLGR